MDAFVIATTWHYMTFAKTARGDVWRIWFHHDGLPLMGKQFPSHEGQQCCNRQWTLRASALNGGPR